MGGEKHQTTRITRILQMKRIMAHAAAFSSNVNIWTNFERGVYSIKRVPRVLEIDYSGVYVHKNGVHQNEIESLENMDWERDRLLTPKIKGDSYGDYTLLVGIIGTKYFDTREKLDALHSEGYDQDSPVEKVERISLEKALDQLTVYISCNMDYYLSSHDEMEKDLGHKLDDLDMNNKEKMKRLEAELLYSQAIKIFGEDEGRIDSGTDPKSLTFKDFRLLFSDGNDKIATARRGKYYVLFSYYTS